MKLGDYAALQIGSEILEEFEEIETADGFHDVPDDYDESESSKDDDDSKFVYSEAEYNLRDQWPWFKQAVPPKIIELLKEIKGDSYFNLGAYDRILSDMCARCFYEFYTAPRVPEVFLDYVVSEYINIIEISPVEAQMKLIQVYREDWDSDEFNDNLTWPLIRNLTHPMAEIFGYELERLDKYYLNALINKIEETANDRWDY